MSTQKLAKTCCLESSDNELVQQVLTGDMSGFEMLVKYSIFRKQLQRPIFTALNLSYERHYSYIKIR